MKYLGRIQNLGFVAFNVENVQGRESELLFWQLVHRILATRHYIVRRVIRDDEGIIIQFARDNPIWWCERCMRELTRISYTVNGTALLLRQYGYG